jgi:hypothetical protein
MELYSSPLLNLLYENDPILSPVHEVLHFKRNLLGGTSLADMNGNTIFETMPNVVGGETVMFDGGETAQLTENIYGGTTLDFTGTTNDIVGMPSIFGGESFHQGGEFIGSIEPSFMGNGFDFTSSTGDTLFSTSPDIFGGTEVTFSSPIIDSSSVWDTFDLHNSFSHIDTISSHLSVADIGTATDVFDGLDFLDLF